MLDKVAKSNSQNQTNEYLFKKRCSASECIKSYTMGHFHRNESDAHELCKCSLFHLIKPLTSDFLASSHRDRNTLKQLMSGHRIVLSLSTNLHQVWQRNSQESRRQGSKENTQEDGPQYAVVCFLAPPDPLFRHLP